MQLMSDQGSETQMNLPRGGPSLYCDKILRIGIFTVDVCLLVSAGCGSIVFIALFHFAVVCSFLFHFFLLFSRYSSSFSKLEHFDINLVEIFIHVFLQILYTILFIICSRGIPTRMPADVASAIFIVFASTLRVTTIFRLFGGITTESPRELNY